MIAPEVRFDDVVPRIADTIVEVFGEQVLAAGTVLRDAAGRANFFLGAEVSDALYDRADQLLATRLGRYARDAHPLVRASDPRRAALGETATVTVETDANGVRRQIRVVDRRVVGVDWLRAPQGPAEGPKRIVYASLKGGVGRTTALAVAASHLAARGQRVLAVDLDLEAPGLGAMLLDDDTCPELGTLDYFVEARLGPPDATFLRDLLGPCALQSRGGLIHVAPAFGRRSIDRPGNVLAKLGRAYVEHRGPDGRVITLRDQTRALIDALAKDDAYDVVLVDARAGLHESSAASLLGLGAETLLFGLDERQTFQGYAPLIAQLGGFARSQPNGLPPEWFDRFTPIHAKASAEPERAASFGASWNRLLDGVLNGQEEPVPAGVTSEPDFDPPWDDDAPDEAILPPDWGSLAHPIAILSDASYAGFDPLRADELLSGRVLEATFGDYLAFVDKLVDPARKSL